MSFHCVNKYISEFQFVTWYNAAPKCWFYCNEMQHLTGHGHDTSSHWRSRICSAVLWPHLGRKVTYLMTSPWVEDIGVPFLRKHKFYCRKTRISNVSQTHPSNGPQTRTLHSTIKSCVLSGKPWVFSGHELIYYKLNLYSCVFRLIIDDDDGYDDDDDNDGDDGDHDDDDDDGELELARASPRQPTQPHP